MRGEYAWHGVFCLKKEESSLLVTKDPVVCNPFGTSRKFFLYFFVCYHQTLPISALDVVSLLLYGSVIALLVENLPSAVFVVYESACVVSAWEAFVQLAVADVPASHVNMVEVGLYQCREGSRKAKNYRFVGGVWSVSAN